MRSFFKIVPVLAIALGCCASRSLRAQLFDAPPLPNAVDSASNATADLENADSGNADLVDADPVDGDVGGAIPPVLEPAETTRDGATTVPPAGGYFTPIAGETLAIQPSDDDHSVLRLPPPRDAQFDRSSNFEPTAEELPLGAPRQSRGDFPALPPDPYQSQSDPLPPLDDELWLHGGSYLHQAEGDRLNWPEPGAGHFQVLRLPEDWQEPRPLTGFTEFLGTGPIRTSPWLRWPGPEGYVWEPRFVGHGSYELFGFALEENSRRQDVLGHQLLVDLDLRLTGTERFHVQFRPLGRNNTGGSFYQFSNPEHYQDNATPEPDRYWFEGELHSMLGGYLDPLAVRDYQFALGRFPFALHNALLINTDLLGALVNKNTIYLGPLSNLNVQVFYGVNDVDAFANADARLYGLHIGADYHRAFFEATYAFLEHEFDDRRDAHFAAMSGTKFVGVATVAARALLKWGDRGGIGSGQLFVLESNYHRQFENRWAGVEHGVFFCNAFLATQGWSNMGGGNFNRLRTAFEVNPLVRISAGRPSDESWGAALGVQLFRLHDDESWVPEFAFEAISGQPVWGFGLRYQRKTGRRTYLEALGVLNYSDDPRLEREGVFVSHTIIF